MEPLIFIVDDDPFFSRIVSSILKKYQFSNIRLFESGEECMNNISCLPKLVFLDYDMKGMNGIDVLIKIREQYPTITVVMVSAQEKIDVALSAIKMGAYDYLIKDNQLLPKIEKTIDELKSITLNPILN